MTTAAFPFYIPEPELFERLRQSGVIKYDRDDLLEALAEAQQAEKILAAADAAADARIKAERQKDFDAALGGAGIDGDWLLDFYLPNRCFELYRLMQDMPRIIRGTPRQLRAQAAAMRRRAALITKEIATL